MKFLRNGGTVWTVFLCQKGDTEKINRKRLLPACEDFQWRFPVRTLTKLNHFAAWWDLTSSQPSVIPL